MNIRDLKKVQYGYQLTKVKVVCFQIIQNVLCVKSTLVKKALFLHDSKNGTTLVPIYFGCYRRTKEHTFTVLFVKVYVKGHIVNLYLFVILYKAKYSQIQCHVLQFLAKHLFNKNFSDLGQTFMAPHQRHFKLGPVPWIKI